MRSSMAASGVGQVSGTPMSLIAARARYPQLQVPIDLVYGEHDWSRTSDRESVHRLLPAATMTVLPDTGHFTALERPADWVRILIDNRQHDQRFDLHTA